MPIPLGPVTGPFNIRALQRLLQGKTKTKESADIRKLLAEERIDQEDLFVDGVIQARSSADALRLQAKECLHRADRPQSHVVKYFYEQLAGCYFTLADAEDSCASRMERHLRRVASAE